MILSAFFFAISDILVKFISPPIGVMQIAFFRFFLGALILLPMLLSGGRTLKGNSTRLLLVRGLAGTAAFLCLTKSITMISLSSAIVLFYTFPLFATVFSFLLLKEPLKKMEILLTIVGTTGIYVLVNPGSHPYTMGHVFGILAGCFAGLVMVFTRILRKTNGPLIIYLYFCIVGGLVSTPFFIAKFTAPDLLQFSLLILLAIIFLIAQVLMNQGFKFCKAPEGSVILMSEVVFAGIAGVFIFSDPLSLSFWVGTVLILGSGVGLNLVTSRGSSSKSLTANRYKR